MCWRRVELLKEPRITSAILFPYLCKDFLRHLLYLVYILYSVTELHFEQSPTTPCDYFEVEPSVSLRSVPAYPTEIRSNVVCTWSVRGTAPPCGESWVSSQAVAQISLPLGDCWNKHSLSSVYIVPTFNSSSTISGAHHTRPRPPSGITWTQSATVGHSANFSISIQL